MVDINFDCPHCNQNLDAPSDMAGETIECPTCRKSIGIPVPEIPAQAGPKRVVVKKRTEAPEAGRAIQGEMPKSGGVLVGKHRNPCAPLFLPLVTFGVYGLVWLYKLYSEASLYAKKRNGTSITSGGAVVGFLFIPIFNIVWAIMLWFKTPGLVTQMRQADGVPDNRRGSTGSLGFLMLIPVLGGILWTILTQNAMNAFWKEARKRHGM
jgi:hypothetical protein